MKKKVTGYTLQGEANAQAVDALAARYEAARADVDLLWKQLWEAASKLGVRPKDAPRTKLLRGAVYEVLASRATRTDVDQKLARKLNQFTRSVCFEAELVYALRDGWERDAKLSARDRKLVARCLVKKSSRRLTVRQIKASPQRTQRRAA
jgi:hypothetical protein